MRPTLLAVFISALVIGCNRGSAPPKLPESYLFVWAGDKEDKASDFLGVIDAAPSSPTYGTAVASIAVNASGTHPHHTEHELPDSKHLLANGFKAGKTWTFDLSDPRAPKVMSSFGGLGGFSHPHTFVRLPNGHVLATFQYRADAAAADPSHAGHGDAAATTGPEHTTGGLVELDETGRLIKSGAASDSRVADSYIYPYFPLPVPALDRVISTTTDMNGQNKKATSQWVQFWSLSDLKLQKTIELKPGPRGDEHKYTGEVRLLPDGKSAYVHTFSCGLYLIRGIDHAEPTASFVHSFEGADCGVPVVAGRFWLQTVPAAHALVALDVTDPEHPREVSRVTFADQEEPHWAAIDPTGRRVVVHSGGSVKTSNRLFIVNFDPATGRLTIEPTFRDAGSTQPGVNLTGLKWPHGFSGTTMPHGTVFSK